MTQTCLVPLLLVIRISGLRRPSPDEHGVRSKRRTAIFQSDLSATLEQPQKKVRWMPVAQDQNRSNGD